MSTSKKITKKVAKRDIEDNPIPGKYEIVTTEQELATIVPDNLTESINWTIANRDFSIYAERFCDAISQATIQEESGDLSCGILSIDQLEDGTRRMQLDVRRVLPNATARNYSAAEAALKLLNSVQFETRVDGVWKLRNLIQEIDIDEVQHIARFKVPELIWSLFANKEKGYRIFNPIVGYLVCPNSYRIYKLVCRQESPLSMRISRLKEMLGLPAEKYKRTCDFADRILDKAKEDLDLNADWSFTYDLVSSEAASNKRGRPSLDMINIYPRRNEKVQELSGRTHPYVNNIDFLSIPHPTLRYLIEKYDFSEKELKNSKVIGPAYTIMRSGGESMHQFLLNNTLNIDRSSEKKSYIVQLLKNHVYQKYGVLLGSKNSMDSFLNQAGVGSIRGGQHSIGELFGAK